MKWFHRFTYHVAAYHDEWISRIVYRAYIPGYDSTALYKERAHLCDTAVNGFLKDAPVENPESEVWDNRRKK